MLKVFCDGSITGSHWGKKGQKDSLPHIWAGWWVQAEDGTVVSYHSWDIGEREGYSANVAEYMAVRSALFWLKGNGYGGHALRVHSDSQLVMNQLAGTYNVHDERLRALRDHVRQLADLFPRVTYTWIPREQNREADVLSKALQIWGRVPTWDEVIGQL